MAPRKNSVFWMCVVLAACSGCEPNEVAEADREPRPVSARPKPRENLNPLSRFEFKTRDKRSSGSPLFRLLPDCGIKFTNSYPREDKSNVLLETGSGVAIADYDGDGLSDVYLLAVEGPNKLYRNLGEFKFEDTTATAGVDGYVLGRKAPSAGATFADIDNDGDLDLHVSNMNAADLLYVNQGDGTFAEEGNLRGIDEDGPGKIGSFCDYDLDGDLDLYLLTYRDTEDEREVKVQVSGGWTTIHPDYRDAYGIVGGKIVESGQRDFLFQNDGRGHFEDVTTAAGLLDHAMGLSVSWTDFNDDGLPDLYVANDAWHPDRLYQNLGDGTFADVLPRVVRHVPWYSKGSDFGDLNGDGLSDIVVGDISGRTDFGRKMLTDSIEQFAWFLEFGAPRQQVRNCVYINSGSDNFMEVAQMTGLAGTNWSWATRLADLNNDGSLDVFVTNGNTRDRMNSDIIRELSRLNVPGKELQFQAAQKKIPPLRESNLAFANRGNLEFEDVSAQWGLDHNGISHGVALADLDNDGDLDLVVNNFDEPALVYRNDSDEGNRLTLALRSQTGNSYGYGSKVELWCGKNRQVKHLVPVRGYLGSDEPVLHFGLGEATRVERLRITWPGGNVQEFKDLDVGFHYQATETESTAAPQQKGDPARTAFAESESGIRVNFTHHDGRHDDFARQPLLPYRASRMGPGVAIGDINNDELPDVFVCNGNDQPGGLFVNRGATIFEEIEGPWKKHFLRDDMGALFFDADGDGDQDLLVTSGGTEYEAGHEILRDRLYLNQQGEVFEFAEKSLPTTGVNSSTLCAVDYDRDGDLDLVIGSRSVPHRYPEASPSRLLRNDKGNFVDISWKVAKPLAEAGIVNSVLASDFDGDGWTDLVLATEWGPVRFLKNNEGKFLDITEDLGVENVTGWWRGLAAADFDCDGDLDYVVTNLGRNTRYRASAEHPHRLYFGDFDDSGRIDLVESHFENGVEFPVHGLRRSAQSIPQLKTKFESFADFARAGLSDIHEFKSDSTSLKEINFLDSAIFWNDGASFRIESLPTMAQVSPGFGVAARDFDCDGDTDILIANNFFGGEPFTGYMDGGLGVLLVNDGSGKFRFVWPNKSGVRLEGDSMGLAVADIDLDGDLDSIVGVHSGEARTLINQANPESSGRLLLQGPAGNPRSVGTLVLLVHQSGRRQLHEVRAGGSYLSQSTHAIFAHAPEGDPVERVEVLLPSGEVKKVERSELDESGEWVIETD